MRTLLAALMILASSARAGTWSGKLGLDAGSFGGIVSHDFSAAATVSGIQWDTEHLLFNGSEVAEVGLFAGKRDVDHHVIVGPSFGTPSGSVATFARNAQEFVDWPILATLEEYGQYAHVYVNLGWDGVRIREAHARPDYYGIGGVLRFGKKG